MYGTEADVGRALQSFLEEDDTISRSDIFVTSKVGTLRTCSLTKDLFFPCLRAGITGGKLRSNSRLWCAPNASRRGTRSRPAASRRRLRRALRSCSWITWT
eukprot:scaffold7347_cov223-Pinguiococcus_pyrenoidosus.AAC.1